MLPGIWPKCYPKTLGFCCCCFSTNAISQHKHLPNSPLSGVADCAREANIVIRNATGAPGTNMFCSRRRSQTSMKGLWLVQWVKYLRPALLIFKGICRQSSKKESLRGAYWISSDWLTTKVIIKTIHWGETSDGGGVRRGGGGVLCCEINVIIL